MIRKTAIAATAALIVAATMAATPAQALSKKGAFFLGLGAATMVGIAAANAHGHSGYYDGYYYNDGRAYRRAANHCANKWGWHTWRWERCMSRKGF